MNWTSRAVYSTTTIFVGCFIEGEKQKEKQSTNWAIKKKNHLQSIWSLILRIKGYDPCPVTQSRYNLTQRISTKQARQQNTIQYSRIQWNTKNTVQYSTMQCNAVPYSAVQQCCTVQYCTCTGSTVRCNVVQCSAVQWRAVKCNTVIECDTRRSNEMQRITIAQ